MTNENRSITEEFMYVSPPIVQDILIHIFCKMSNLHTLCILGEPGCGKTSITKAAIRVCGLNGIFPPPLSMQEACDLRGLPFFNHNTKRTEWYVPDWLPSDPKSQDVIFIDEAPQGDYSTIKPLGQLLVERSIGSYHLPTGVRWTLAGNRRNDSAGASKLPTPVINRIIMVGMNPDVDSWLRWGEADLQPTLEELSTNHLATQSRRPTGLDIAGELSSTPQINHVVRSYFGKYCREHFSTFDPLKQSPFASARSITRLSEFLDSNPAQHIIAPYVCGLVGTGVGMQFVSYLKTYTQVPQFPEVIADPLRYTIPQNNPALQCAISSAAANYCYNKVLANNETLSMNDVGKIVLWMARFPDEYALFFIKELTSHRPQVLSQCKEYRDTFLPKFKEKFRAATQVTQ